MNATRHAARYALRFETADGTIEEAYHFMDRKADAIAAARRAAKDTVCADVVRIWVDDMKTDLGVKAFEVRK